MRGWWTRWWTGQSLRSRVVVSTTAPAAAAIVVGAVAVALVFSTGRVHDLDAQTRTEAQQLALLVTSGQVPSTLPVPAGSPLLAQVLGPDGTVLAATPSASRVLALVAATSPRSRVVTVNDTSYAGTPLRVRAERVTAADGSQVRVVVAAPLGDVHRALRALRVVLFLVVPVLVALTGLVVWSVTGLALRPVERLRSAAEHLAGPQARREVLPVGDDEIGRLGATLNGLLSSLHALVAKQEQFVADAAHELRSPLTSLRVQLDVAQAHPELLDLPHALSDLSAEVSRLEALVQGLLVLARLEGGAQLERVPVDLRELAGADGAATLVMADPAALSRLVDNLRSNALRHAALVRLTTSIEGRWAVLDVDDNGPGIAAEDRDRVFERWVRLDPARSDDQGGAGLGLAIVQEVVRLHGGSVRVLPSPLGGARFEVRLPLASGT